MKRLFALFLLAFASCKKDDCQYCKAYLTNASPYNAVVKVDGLPRPVILPGQTGQSDLSSHSTHRIEVSFVGGLPDHDYSFLQGCDSGCSEVYLLLKY